MTFHSSIDLVGNTTLGAGALGDRVVQGPLESPFLDGYGDGAGLQPLIPERTAPTTASLPAWKARRVAAYIDARLDNGLRVAELSRVAGLSPSYFGKAFLGSFGQSLRDYVLHRRVERAKTLMVETRRALADIAFACGFADQAHLSRTFKQVVGESPARWRRQRQRALQ